MSSRVCATGHIKHPMPLIEKSRVWCPGGRFLINTVRIWHNNISWSSSTIIIAQMNIKEPLSLSNRVFIIASTDTVMSFPNLSVAQFFLAAFASLLSLQYATKRQMDSHVDADRA